jgi:hypothetical protein
MSEETKVISLSKLIRYNNKLKPLVITDADIDDNTLTLKYLDNNTKELTLPSGGGSPSLPTRSVTRVPLYFEIHFRLSNNDGYVASKLNVPIDIVRDIVSVENDIGKLGYTVISDITETAKEDDYDTVYLAAVNINPRGFYGYYSGGVVYDLKLNFKPSFGDFILQTEPFIDSINKLFENIGTIPITLPETLPAQVMGASDPLSIYKESTENHHNRFKVYAVLDTKGFIYEEGEFIHNDTVGLNCYYNNRFSVAFDLELQNVTNDETPYTFTETMLP